MKNPSKLLIIDGSYLLHRSLKIQELWDLKSSKTGLRTGGIFGFLRSLNYEFKKYDYYPIVCWDLGLSDRRIAAYDRYKKHHIRVAERMLSDCNNDLTEFSIKAENEFRNEITFQEVINSIRESIDNQRHADAAEHTPEDDYRAQYHRQRDVLINILHALGVPSIIKRGWEGDDLMTLATRLANKSIVMTDDKDLIQLIAPNVDIARPMQKKYLEYSTYLAESNLDSSREIAIIKAIEGDGSDNIPAVTSGLERKYCVGHTRACQIAKIIMENDEDPSKYLPILRESGKNYFLGFVSRHEDYERNMELVDLSLVPDDDAIYNQIRTEYNAIAGKCNLLNAMKLLSEQDIYSFDTSSFVSKMQVLSIKL